MLSAFISHDVHARNLHIVIYQMTTVNHHLNLGSSRELGGELPHAFKIEYSDAETIVEVIMNPT